MLNQPVSTHTNRSGIAHCLADDCLGNFHYVDSLLELLRTVDAFAPSIVRLRRGTIARWRTTIGQWQKCGEANPQRPTVCVITSTGLYS